MSDISNFRSINVFQKYLSVWVILCMAIGIAIGYYIPGLPATLDRFEYANVSIPVAVLIWVMIYPMMMKVDFKSIKNVGNNPKGLFVTWITNWLIKPFTMYAIAFFFFFIVFKSFITPELATEYLAGAILLGAAPCTAMVFVSDSVHSDCQISAGSQQYHSSMEHLIPLDSYFCRHSALGRDSDSNRSCQEARNRVF